MKPQISQEWLRQKLAMAGEEPTLVGTVDTLFPNAKEEIASKICPTCHNPITKFDDELSEKEYRISGMCQECQDKIFMEE